MRTSVSPWVEASQAQLSAWERDGGKKRVVWIIARQHPGESMASWWMEGFVRRLLDAQDPMVGRCRLTLSNP
jgi:murein tripeptide amidase MpaA